MGIVKARSASHKAAMGKEDDRAARLAAQLRANLRKRKARERGGDLLGVDDGAPAHPTDQRDPPLVTR